MYLLKTKELYIAYQYDNILFYIKVIRNDEPVLPFHTPFDEIE